MGRKAVQKAEYDLNQKKHHGVHYSSAVVVISVLGAKSHCIKRHYFYSNTTVEDATDYIQYFVELQL